MENHRLLSAVFITFPGNCKKALTFYQSCFGGRLQFEPFDRLLGAADRPIVSGSLVSDRVIIHGSDLVHNEGRQIGNYISIYVHCESQNDRKRLIEKLQTDRSHLFTEHIENQKLMELTDAFDVRWVLGV